MKPEHIKLLELAEKATQGEWLREDGCEVTVSENGDESYSEWEVAGPAHVPSSRWSSDKSKEDADYIVAAQPRVVKELILELEEMRNALIEAGLTVSDIAENLTDAALLKKAVDQANRIATLLEQTE